MKTNSSYDERALLYQVTLGNEIAFGELFYTYHNKLGAYVLKLTESFPLTQEIVQDTFLKIWQNRQSLHTINNFSAYLFVSARNRTFNCLKQIARERTRMQEWENDLGEQTEMEDQDVAPGSVYGYDTLIDHAIDQLPPQQKKVYLLHRREGIDHAEIASRLSLSPATVKKHMSLALRSIRRFIRSEVGQANIVPILLLALFTRG